MDDQHEAELARILANRKKGGRLLGAPQSDIGGQQQQRAPIPAPTQTPTQSSNDAGITLHSPTQPTQATRTISDTVGSGAIVFENDNAKKQQQQPLNAKSTTNPSSYSYSSPSNDRNREYLTTEVTSAEIRTRPTGQQQQQHSSPEIAELERIRRQGEDQARQIQHLQQSLDSLIHLQKTSGGNNNNTFSNNNDNQYYSSSSQNYNDNNQGAVSRGGIVPPPSTRSPRRNNNATTVNQQQLPSNNTKNNGGGSVESKFEQASQMGIFVKPHRVVSDKGKGYITFQSASRNTRGVSAGRSSPRKNGASPNNNNRQIARSTNFADEEDNYNNDQQGNFNDGNNNNNNNTGLVASPSSAVRNNNGAVRIPRRNPGGDERIPKPYSTSTVDIDSAIVLLTTGDWFYKLRVQVSNASIVGPAGWQIEASDRRYVYLDTNTYILKWGDKPGGSATIFSHYVLIDQIVSVNVFAQSEPNFNGPEPRTVYYIVMNIVEGGFNARGRAVKKRLCVLATELRDKADMWIDALQTIRTFYRSKGTAAQRHGKTYSSD